MSDTRKHLRNPDFSSFPDVESDQQKGIPAPPIEKEIPRGARLIDLVPPEQFPTTLGDVPLIAAIRDRQSHRSFNGEPLSLLELSFLLWSTQGIRSIHPKKIHAFRTVPSGGCRHPFETYLRIRNVEGVVPGLYRYAPIEHQLVELWPEDDRSPQDPTLGAVCFGQSFVETATVSFVWTAIPYRSEWRYPTDSLKDILLSCGHICQNLYLACEAIRAGTCAIVAYSQSMLDTYLGVDGDDEIALYVAPVGKIEMPQ